MLLLIIRTIILYFLILLMMKIMGKRQIGQLQPFELAVILIFSEMASSSMQSTASPILYSIIPIATITVVQVIMAIVNLKSEKFRDLICGRPSIIISKGRIVQSEMKRLRMNINDLQEQLRSKGYFDITDVEYAVMETNGQLSVMPKTPKRTIQVEDLAMELEQEEPSTIVILDGHVNNEALNSIGKNSIWLEKELNKRSIKNAEDVFVASIDDEGIFSYQLKDEEKRAKK
ncbi:MAG: DUF421 domain-containing protein [Bacillota bacterium]|jgi:uncharacterized membrane protein YcaP (DUF421 family)